MNTKVGINGFGRIGRLVFNALTEPRKANSKAPLPLKKAKKPWQKTMSWWSTERKSNVSWRPRTLPSCRGKNWGLNMS